MTAKSIRPKFFKTEAAFHTWLEKQHDSKDELIVGYYKKTTGKPSMTWEESVDEALCFGWIDGIRRRLDDERYCIRFTPRRRTSHWSARNIKRMQELVAEGRVQACGVETFKLRKASNSRKASYEQKKVKLSTEYETRIKANVMAWIDWQKRPPGYKKQTSWWIMSAKQEASRQRRLDILIESCAKGDIVPQLRFGKNKKSS